MSDRPAAQDATAAIGALALFSAFLKIGALGFGGVAPIARHVLVVERHLLDERAYAELFGLASTLPGANTVNLATMLGDRLAGTRGAVAALGGLMGVPLGVVAIAAAAYGRYGGDADVRAGLAGAAAATAGLVVATSLRLLASLGGDAIIVVPAIAVCAAAVGGVPLAAILVAAVPVSIALQASHARRR